MNLYKYCNKEPYSFLVNYKTLPPDNSLRFGKIYYKITFSEKSKQSTTKLSKTKLNMI